MSVIEWVVGKLVLLFPLILEKWDRATRLTGCISVGYSSVDGGKQATLT
ncbi:MAG: hypothetical protein NVS2B12_34950 [Ktedonobacteraceae bacterium]